MITSDSRVDVRIITWVAEEQGCWYAYGGVWVDMDIAMTIMTDEEVVKSVPASRLWKHGCPFATDMEARTLSCGPWACGIYNFGLSMVDRVRRKRREVQIGGMEH